jgi:hypothetical protein
MQNPLENLIRKASSASSYSWCSCGASVCSMLGGRVAWDASLPSDDAVERELQREDDDDDDNVRVREQQPEREVAFGRGDAGYGKGSSWDSPGAALLGGWIGSRTVIDASPLQFYPAFHKGTRVFFSQDCRACSHLFSLSKVRYSGRASHATSSTPGTAWVPPPAPAPPAPPDPRQHAPQKPPPLHVEPGMVRAPPSASPPKRRRTSETDGGNSTGIGGGRVHPPPKRRRRKRGEAGSSAISDGDRYSIP